MKYARPVVVAVALALAGLSSVKGHAQTEKKAGVAAPAVKVDTALLAEIAGARKLPAGLDESSPDLAKIIALIASGKTKPALVLADKYAKAHGKDFEKSQANAMASWIVRRALLVPKKDLFAAVDKLRFAKEGKLALHKYDKSLAGKAATDLVAAFELKAYAEGADAVTVSKKKKKVSIIRKDFEDALKELEAQDKLVNFELQKASTYKLMMEILSNVSKTRSEISMTFARNARA